MTTALITGASSGIGLEFARQLAARGDDLVLVARNEAKLTEVASQLTARHNVNVEVLVADLGTCEGLDAVAQRVASTDRAVDVLVNNAGFGVKTRFLDTDLETELSTIDVLVKAVMVLSHAAGKAMTARGHGLIINVSSVASFMATGTYSAAKAYVTVFSESLATQLAGTGVHVMALCPGFTHTEFHQRGDIPVDKTSAFGKRLWLTAEQLVSEALKDADAGKFVSVPGTQYKVLVSGLRLVPRRVVNAALSNRHRPQK